MSQICIHCDVDMLIGKTQSSMDNACSKYKQICRRHNNIKQLLSIGVISLNYVRSKDNITNLITKWLNRKLVERSLRGM